ncbi:Zinc finger, CCHC-type [Sesbania bispinosa]|nr:Zinc finger, CCHC-type [Sesbania bispinosa]
MEQEPDVSVTEFYTKFKTLVDELNEQQPLPECTYGASKEMNQREEDQRVHLFLGSLDNERFAHVKANILNTDPLPSLRCTFNHILREEARFTAEKERNSKTESGSAFYSFSTNKQKRRDGPKPRCDHCGKVGHVKSKCFELVGYPPNWNTRRPQRGPNRTGGQPTAHLAQVNESHEKADNAEEIIMGRALCGTYVKRNTEQHETIAGNDKTIEDQQWVLDSGASHHMTPLFSLLKGVRNLEKPFYITVPTGNTVLVEKMGFIDLNRDIKLNNVLFVPDFSCNLISIHQLTNDLSCTVTYHANYCVIQDQTTKRMIGSGDLHDGVYVLKRAT